MWSLKNYNIRIAIDYFVLGHVENTHLFIKNKKNNVVSQKMHITYNYKIWNAHSSILKLNEAMCKTHYMLGVKYNKSKKLIILPSITWRAHVLLLKKLISSLKKYILYAIIKVGRYITRFWTQMGNVQNTL